MARYIDADRLTKTLFPIGLIDDGKYTINAKAVKYAIDNTPTSDVAPKTEVEGLEKECKYWETEAKEARADLTESTQEVAREIFEEIEKNISENLNRNYADRYFNLIVKIDELKKKYTEGDNE